MKIKFQQKKKNPKRQGNIRILGADFLWIIPCPYLKMTPPPHTHWKAKPSSREWFLEKKKPKKLETVINTSVLLIKQHWKNMAEIPLKRDFLTWSIQNFVRKGKQFDRRYDVTWLIDLANKLYDVEQFLDFILCHVLLKIILFY